MHYYLGIDCGGTFIKAAIFDQNGTLQSIARRNIPIISENPVMPNGIWMDYGIFARKLFRKL